MGKVLYILLFSTNMLFISSLCFGDKPIVLTSGEWAPFTGKDLKEEGILSYIVREAFKLKGKEVKYVYMPWKRALLVPQTDKSYDGSLGWSPKPEREKHYHYSDVVLENIQVFFHLKKKEFNWNIIEDIKKYNLGAGRGYSYGPKLDKFIKENSNNITFVTDEAQGLKLLLNKRFDIFPSSFGPAIGILAKLPAEDIRKITYNKKPIRASTNHVILSRLKKENIELIKIFNEGLRELIEKKGEQWIHRPCQFNADKAEKLTTEEKNLYKALCPKVTIESS